MRLLNRLLFGAVGQPSVDRTPWFLDGMVAGRRH